MSVHGEKRNICPYCLAKFESRQGVKAHQKAKRHRVQDMEDGAEEAKAARREVSEAARMRHVLRKAATHYSTPTDGASEAASTTDGNLKPGMTYNPSVF